MVITIEVKTEKVKNMITGYIRTIPEATARGSFELARFGAKQLKIQAMAAGIKPWGGGNRKLFSRQTRAKKAGKGVWQIVMPLHGKFLDSMRPHWVSLKRGRLITKWAKDKGITAGSIFVRPHPFVASAVTVINQNAKRIIEKEINRTIRRKGKR